MSRLDIAGYRRRRRAGFALICATLVGCGEAPTAPTPETARAPNEIASTQQEDARTTGDAESAIQLPTGPASPSAAAALPGPFPLPDGFDAVWEPWFAHVDWVIGMEAGQAAARKSGKPMLLFYTATW